MNLKNTTTSYGTVTKFFHWLLFVLVTGMLTFGFLLGFVPKAYQAVAYNSHKMTGLTILCLMCLWVLWSLFNPKPQLNGTVFENTLARLVHLLIYVLLIAMPLSGWIGSIAGGRPPHLGSLSFSLPIPPDKALAGALFQLHGTLALIIITVLSLHVLAALYHYFIRKDQILQRML